MREYGSSHETIHRHVYESICVQGRGHVLGVALFDDDRFSFCDDGPAAKTPRGPPHCGGPARIFAGFPMGASWVLEHNQRTRRIYAG